MHVRNKCGIGQKVETSMYQGAMAIRSPMLPEADGISKMPSNNLLPQGGLPGYRMYPCADGKWLHIGCLTREFWDKFAVALDLLDLATEPEFELAPSGWSTDQDRELAMDLIGNRLLERPRDYWLSVLAESDVPSAPVLTTQEYMDLPQVRHSGLVQTVRDPILGEMDQVGMAIDFSETPGRTRMSAPQFGQHTDEVLASLEHTGNPSRGTGNSAKSSESPSHPLEGMKVLDLSSFIAAPLGTMMLSDLGADVIKVEPLSGEGARPLAFLIIGGNRGKRNLALDLKSPAAKGIIDRLLGSCDVVVHNMREGIAERLGIDYDAVRHLRPDVIYVHVTGYGSSGPDKLKPGFDPLFRSMSGTTARQGASTERPVFLRTPVCDDTNAMLLAAGVLMALHHRDRTGQGQKLDLSLLKTAALINSDDFMRYQGKEDRTLADDGLYGFSAVKRLYKASDGWIFLDCNQDQEWESLKKSLNESWLGDEITFNEANRMHPWNEELCRDLAEVFERRPADDWEQLLVAVGVPCCRVAKDNEEGFYQHPQALHLGMIDENMHPDYSNLRQVGVQVRFSETPSADRLPAANIGQHSIEILQELGFSELGISDMRGARCIGVP
jgi:crotonobetainyl-CoA:carnitine CoA-transferase CaiB-like acyl-CoA transferase